MEIARKKNTIVMVGGGTAGHVVPNLALADDLLKDNIKVHYIGTNAIEKNLVTKHKSIIFHQITAEKFRRSLTLKNLTIPFKVYKGYKETIKILKQVQPKIVFSKGGFVAVPVVLAAAKLKIPIISHESDLTLGLANKIIYKKCKTMFTSFKETANYGKKCTHSGSIIRHQIFNGQKPSNLNLNPNKKTVLIMGGSLGANKINQAVWSCIDELTKNFNVIHICGKNKINNGLKKTNYLQIEFTSQIENYFAACDFVVSRAGSNSIFEFLALKKPMLLIPLSSGRGDQIDNAKNFENQKLARVLTEDNLTPKKLLNEIFITSQFSFPEGINCKNGNQIVIAELKKYLIY